MNHQPALPTRVSDDLVSVVLSTYNGEAYVAAAIDSVLSQTYPACEVIVIDDGSRDGSWEVLQRYGDRIRAVRQPNAGLAGARNAGLALARGELIALMDHDDLCEPDRIATQVAVMCQQPDLVLCSSDFSAFDSRGLVARTHIADYYSRCSVAQGGVGARYARQALLSAPDASGEAAEPLRVLHGHVYDEMALGNFVHPPTVMFRRGLLDQVGPFDGSVGSMCDWEWLIKAAAIGPFGYIDRPLLKYRRSETQMSSAVGYARGSLSALAVVVRLIDRDPALMRRQKRALTGLLGELSLDAAYANAPLNRLLALRLLAQSAFAFGHVSSMSLRTLFKLAMPTQVVSSLSALRHRRA